MSDNVVVTPGLGKTIATDEIAGVNHQRVKMEHGADGTAIDVSKTDPLPVTGPMVTDKYDYVGMTYPTTTTEVYAFKQGGAAGLLIATITIVYSDATKLQITSATRT